MRLEKHRALILETRGTGEADLVVWALNSQGNQIRFVAKGARKTMSRFSALVQPFVFAELVVYAGPGLPILRQAACLEAFAAVRSDLKKCLPGFAALELCRLLVAEEGGEREVFSLTLSYLRHLQSNPYTAAALNTYRLGIASALGYGQFWESCVLCGTPVTRGVADWNNGGLVCQSCPGKGLSLTPAILAILRFLARTNYTCADRLTADQAQLARISRIIDDLFNFLTEGKTKAQVTAPWPTGGAVT